MQGKKATKPPEKSTIYGVEWWAIERLKPYPRNPRLPGKAIEVVAQSLRTFGWRQPLVVALDGTIIVGHVRYAAAQRLGMVEVPVHVAADLTPLQHAAYRIADNSSHDIATWDEGVLLDELAALEHEFPEELLGFALDDLDDPAASVPQPWDFSLTQDEFVLTVRGPLPLQAEARKLLATLPALHVEISVVELP